MTTTLDRITLLREVVARPRRPRVVSLEEVRILERCRPNMLITGEPEKTAQALDELNVCLRTPVTRWSAGRALMLPSRATAKTLVVTEPALMSADEQEQLLQWMRRDDGFVQVITISSVPLFDLIETARFSDSLYYYLNVVHIDVSS